jgi:hypothetical protein
LIDFGVWPSQVRDCPLFVDLFGGDFAGASALQALRTQQSAEGFVDSFFCTVSAELLHPYKEIQSNEVPRAMKADVMKKQ